MKQIKLPVPYETTGKDSNPLKKIETKFKTLSKIGSEKNSYFYWFQRSSTCS